MYFYDCSVIKFLLVFLLFFVISEERRCGRRVSLIFQGKWWKPDFSKFKRWNSRERRHKLTNVSILEDCLLQGYKHLKNQGQILLKGHSKTTWLLWEKWVKDFARTFEDIRLSKPNKFRYKHVGVKIRNFT